MMNLIIEYAYTHFIPIAEDNVEELLVAADQFSIMDVVHACCDFLEAQLCVDNCIGIYKFAAFYSCQELCQSAFLYILNHFEEVVMSEELPQLSLQELCDIVGRDELNVKKEEVVFDAILRWIYHSPTERKAFIGPLLSKMRMALINADYLMNNVRGNQLVCQSQECRLLILNALKSMYELNMTGPNKDNFLNPLARPRLPSSVLFAVGGWSDGNPTDVIETYDIRADNWVKVSCRVGSLRAYHGTAYLNGFVYVIGGFDGMDYFNSVEKFNPVTHTWHQVAPMHSRRCYVSVTSLDGHIYSMGGFDGYIRLNTAERYEPESNQWTVISHMHEQRSDASATTLNGKVYICGGFNGSECLFTAECYCPRANQWTFIEPMRSPRSGLGVIACGGHIYAIGGFNGISRQSSGEAYSPETKTWHRIPSMFHPRSNFGTAIVDGLLFVVGGFNGLATTCNAECFSEKTNEWYDIQDMGVHRSALSCCVLTDLPSLAQYTIPRAATPSLPKGVCCKDN
ncbi:kelch-like protein 10 [Chanos chanos]|uniref:Kelch-like protein 10 n=1 Tax=Chanos chanos TaxID=29144 RepID=A0A6J2VDE5_CHACN|nr:kelch-like protein 10 [Chanos chanos]